MQLRVSLSGRTTSRRCMPVRWALLWNVSAGLKRKRMNREPGVGRSVCLRSLGSQTSGRHLNVTRCHGNTVQKGRRSSSIRSKVAVSELALGEHQRYHDDDEGGGQLKLIAALASDVSGCDSRRSMMLLLLLSRGWVRAPQVKGHSFREIVWQKAKTLRPTDISGRRFIFLFSLFDF